MLIFGILLILTLLSLFQINVLPLNLAFSFVVAFFLISRRDFSFWWILFVSVLIGLFANLNIGLVVLAFTTTFLVVDILSRLFPDNRLVKGGLLIAALVLSEYSLISLGKVLGWAIKFLILVKCLESLLKESLLTDHYLTLKE